MESSERRAVEASMLRRVEVVGGVVDLWVVKSNAGLADLFAGDDL